MAILGADEITGTFSGSSAPASRGSLCADRAGWFAAGALGGSRGTSYWGIGRLKLRAARKFRGPVYASERLNGSPLKASLCWPTVSIAQNKKPAAPPAKSPRKRQNRDDMSKPPLRSGRPHVACEAGDSVDPRKFHTPRKFRKLSGPPAGRASKGS